MAYLSDYLIPWSINYNPAKRAGRIFDANGNALDILEGVTEQEIYDYAFVMYGPPRVLFEVPKPTSDAPETPNDTHTSPRRYDPPRTSEQQPQ